MGIGLSYGSPNWHKTDEGTGIQEPVFWSLTQRVQVPSILGLWSKIPLRVWFLGPETLNIGYLDPLGKDNVYIDSNANDPNLIRTLRTIYMTLKNAFSCICFYTYINKQITGILYTYKLCLYAYIHLCVYIHTMVANVASSTVWHMARISWFMLS